MSRVHHTGHFHQGPPSPQDYETPAPPPPSYPAAPPRPFEEYPPPPPQRPPGPPSYQGYFDQYAPSPHHVQRRRDGTACLSFLRGCLTALCCCCVLEECGCC